MRLDQTIELLRRFPQDAELEVSDYGLYVYCYGYEGRIDYPYDCSDEELPKIWKKRENHDTSQL